MQVRFNFRSLKKEIGRFEEVASSVSSYASHEYSLIIKLKWKDQVHSKSYRVEALLDVFVLTNVLDQI